MGFLSIYADVFKLRSFDLSPCIGLSPLSHSPLCIATEPVFLKVYRAQESIPRNEFRQSIEPGWPVPIPTRFLAPIDCLKIPAQDTRSLTAIGQNELSLTHWFSLVIHVGCPRNKQK